MQVFPGNEQHFFSGDFYGFQRRPLIRIVANFPSLVGLVLNWVRNRTRPAAASIFPQMDR